VGIGVGVGLAAALALAKLVPPELLPVVSARDPLTFVATTALLCLVALIASCIPAYRATHIDPLIALRAE
jgi:putative ABC transport system permease protein